MTDKLELIKEKLYPLLESQIIISEIHKLREYLDFSDDTIHSNSDTQKLADILEEYFEKFIEEDKQYFEAICED